MGEGGRRATRLDRIALGALGLVVVGAPLPLGATPGWAVVGVTVLAGVALLASAAVARTRATGVAVPATMLLACGLAVWTGLQALPLPCAVAAWVHPAAAEAATSAASLTGAAPWCAASLDPGATRERFLVAWGLASVFGSALLLASTVGRRPVVMLVGISAVLGAVVGGVHWIAGATELFGVLSPVSAVPRLVGPFVNPNVAGGMHALGALVCMTLAADADARSDTLAWGTLAFLCAAMCIATLSRGAVAALVAGMVLMALALGRRRRGRHASLPRLGSRGLLVMPAVVAAWIVATDASRGVLGDELGSSDLSKLDLIGRAAQFALSAPWTGVGRGAFGVAFAREVGTLQRFEHAESFPVEWVVDWGIPVAVLALVVIGRDVLDALRRSKKTVTRGAIVALFAYGCHNLVDLGTEIYGSVLVAAALAGAGFARHADSAATPRVWTARRITIASSAVGLVTILVALASGMPVVTSQTAVARAQLERSLRERDHASFQNTLREALRAHPSEPALALLAAAESVQRDAPDAVRWITRAMQLAPRWPAPHELAARWLFAHGRHDQAVLELREIARLDEGSAVTVLCRLPVAQRRADTILFVARASRRGLAMAERVAGCLDARGDELSRLDESLLGVRPRLRGPQLRDARRAIERGGEAHGIARARALVAALPDDADAELLLAEALVRARKGPDALAVLQRAEQRGSLPRAALPWKARALAMEGDFDAMRLVFEEMRGLSGGEGRLIAEVDLQLGTLEESARHHGQALRAYEQALRIAPNAAALRGIIRCAERLALPDRVRSARQELCELVADEPGCPAR